MSRNPVLTDKAFGETPTAQGASPAQEWDSAQQGAAAAVGLQGQGQSTAAATPPAGSGRVMTLGGVSAATLFIFTFLLLHGIYSRYYILSWKNPRAPLESKWNLR